MLWATDDIRIDAIKPLIPPAILIEELPLDDTASELITMSRRHISDCIQGRDPRLVCIVGPCSIHDPQAAIDYAARLKMQADRLADDLLVVRSEEHTSELQSRNDISYAVFCLKKKSVLFR